MRPARRSRRRVRHVYELRPGRRSTRELWMVGRQEDATCQLGLLRYPSAIRRSRTNHGLPWRDCIGCVQATRRCLLCQQGRIMCKARDVHRCAESINPREKARCTGIQHQEVARRTRRVAILGIGVGNAGGGNALASAICKVAAHARSRGVYLWTERRRSGVRCRGRD